MLIVKSGATLNFTVENIKEIWYVRAKISPFLPSPHRINNMLVQEIQSLKEALREQTTNMGNLSETIEKLVFRV